MTKVNNIDMIAKDVRILNYKGELSNKGRLEYRLNGVWGTVCADSIDQSIAKTACIEAGYNGGNVLNPSGSRGFCRNFEGMDICGLIAEPVHFSQMNCKNTDGKLVKCYREIPSSTCSHEFDLLVDCSNQAVSSQVVNIKPNTLRLVDDTNNPTKSGIGRLEIYKRSWGTICNNSFGNKEAKIACIQMGYLDGSIIGRTGSNVVCSNVNGSNYCADESTDIYFTEIKCKGNEREISECEKSELLSECSHLRDTVVKCLGNGDPSGKSQNIREVKTLKPSQEILPMPPIYNASCVSTLKDLYFRGDPGSIFMVKCPASCDRVSANVFGISIYTIGSSICKAGIQSGVIYKDGGNLIITKTFGQNNYEGYVMRNITSIPATNTKTAFYITTSNSAFDHYTAAINTLKTSQSSQIDLTTISFLQKSETYALSPNSSSLKLLSSFAWEIPEASFIFNGHSDFIDLLQTYHANEILNYKTFTLHLKIKLIDFDSIAQTIFSIGGCEGFSVLITGGASLVIDEKCGSKVFDSGIRIPLNDITITISYDGSSVYFFNNSTLANKLDCLFTFKYKEKITLGKSSEADEMYFHGQIYFIVLFKEPLGVLKVRDLIWYGYLKPKSDKINQLYTVDNRKCLSTCVIDPTPGKDRCPDPPIEALKCQLLNRYR